MGETIAKVGRCRPAHQDGQSNSDRDRHDRRLRGTALRLQSWPQSGNRAAESVASGAAGSWSLSNYGPRIIAGNFDPGFFVEHFIKDMGIALAESRRMGLAMPGLALAEQLYQAVAAQGYGRKGNPRYSLALADLSRVDWQARKG